MQGLNKGKTSGLHKTTFHNMPYRGRTWNFLLCKNLTLPTAVVTSPLAFRWMHGSPRMECAQRTTPIYTWREQAVTEWLRHMISNIACCHSVKLCTPATRIILSQHGHVGPCRPKSKLASVTVNLQWTKLRDLEYWTGLHQEKSARCCFAGFDVSLRHILAQGSSLKTVINH